MAMVHLKVLPALAESLGIEATAEEAIAPGAGDLTVRDLLDGLCNRYRHFDGFVYDRQARRLTGQVVLFLNDRNLDLVDGLETRLRDGDVLTFIPFIEGG